MQVKSDTLLINHDSQTSPASGQVNQMGKGYVQWQEIAGTDLQSHFEAAFARLVCVGGICLTSAYLSSGTTAVYECSSERHRGDLVITCFCKSVNKYIIDFRDWSECSSEVTYISICCAKIRKKTEGMV